jgi:hypothetical protein
MTLLVIIVVLSLIYVFTMPDAGGAPDGSSYGTQGDGAAAFAALLEHRGYDVEQRRVSFSESAPGRDVAVIVFDAGRLDEEESESLERFVRSGGRLVVVGTDPGFAVPDRVTAGRELAVYGPWFPDPGFAGIDTITAPGGDVWSEPGGLVPLYGDDRYTLVGMAALGNGRLFAISDPATLSNRGLGATDNAALAVAVVGPPGRVEFAEHVHGYGPLSGLGGLPVRWQWAVGGLAAAAALFMVARSRRLGPPLRAARDLPPPRVRYVDALAAGLMRTGDRPGTGRVLESEIRHLLEVRGVGVTDAQALDRLTARLGLGKNSIREALEADDGEAALLNRARVIARLSRKGR